MFSDRFGLTQAVLDGRKTMTRRIESGMENLAKGNFCFLKGKKEIELYVEKGTFIETIKPRYKVGEVVAVAQNYYEVYEELKRTHGSSSSVTREFFHKYVQGGRMPVSNKMFVRADLMPYCIRITDIKVERLQNISDEDCLKEGIRLYATGIPQCKTQVVGSLDFIPPYGFDDYHHKHFCNFDTPREAFAALIDKVSGKGTWDSNPWVFAYEFILI